MLECLVSLSLNLLSHNYVKLSYLEKLYTKLSVTDPFDCSSKCNHFMQMIVILDPEQLFSMAAIRFHRSVCMNVRSVT